MNALGAIFLSLAVLFSGAQSGAAVRGQVFDPAGAVIARATIRVLEEDSRKTAQNARSDAEGRFVVQELPPGRYLLAVSGPGFAEQLIPTGEVGEGAEVSRKIRLEVLDCDAPGVNCDIFTSGPYTDPHPVRLQRNLTVAAAQAVDLDQGSLISAQSRDADFRLAIDGGGLYIVPLNKAAFAARGQEGSCAKAREKEPRMRIDGLGPGTEILMKTSRGQCARIFLTREIAPDAAKLNFTW